MNDTPKENKKSKSKKSKNKKTKKTKVVQFAEEEAETHRIPAIPLEHKEDVYYSRQELLEQRNEVMDVLAQPPDQQQQQQQKKKKKKKKQKISAHTLTDSQERKLSKRQKWQLQHIRAINERRACFRKWVYIRNRCYVLGAIGYAIYFYMYCYDAEDGIMKSFMDHIKED